MSDTLTNGGGTFGVGDQVQQLAQIGLAWTDGPLYVLAVVSGWLVLSRTPDGEALTDLEGNPTIFPSSRYRKLIKGQVAA